MKYLQDNGLQLRVLFLSTRREQPRRFLRVEPECIIFTFKMYSIQCIKIFTFKSIQCHHTFVNVFILILLHSKFNICMVLWDLSTPIRSSCCRFTFVVYVVLFAIGVTFFLRGWELTSNRTFRKFEDTTLCTNVPLLLVTFLCCSIPELIPNLHEETVFEVFSFHPAESETLATIWRLSCAS